MDPERRRLVGASRGRPSGSPLSGRRGREIVAAPRHARRRDLRVMRGGRAMSACSEAHGRRTRQRQRQTPHGIRGPTFRRSAAGRAARGCARGARRGALPPALAPRGSPRSPAAAAPLAVDPGPRFVPESFAELADRLSPAVVNITTTTIVAGVDDSMRPVIPAGSPFEDFFRDFMDRQPGAAAPPAALERARLGLHRLAGRLHRHQQPRHRERRRDLGRALPRRQPRRAPGRPRHPHRHRAAEGRQRRAAAVRRVRRQRRGAGRRLGAGHRQPARPGLLGLRRHRLGAQPHAAGHATTTSSRPTPRSTAATPAGRSSTCRAG